MNQLETPFGIILFVLLMLGGCLLLNVTTAHRQRMRFQVRLFCIAIGVRFAASIAIYNFGLVSVLGDEDASGWAVGVSLMQDWVRRDVGILDLPLALASAFEGQHRGYHYLLGGLFYLTDSPGRMPAAALNCFFGALTVVLAYRVTRTLFPERVAVWVGWFACFAPSLIVWSAQTVKEPIVILLETVALYCCIRLRQDGFSMRYLLICGLAIVALTAFRFYAAYIAGFAVLITLLLPQLSRRRFTIGTAAGIAALVIPLLFYSGILARHETELEKFDLQRIQDFRRNVATGPGGGSGVRQSYDLNTPGGFVMAAAVGGAHLLLAPFPWQLGGGSLRLLFTLPELAVWWWLFFAGVIPGLWYLLRNRFGDIQALLIFVAGLGLLYSLMFGNVGLIYRQRAQLLPWLLIFAAVGIELRRMKRQERNLRKSLQHITVWQRPGVTTEG
jgi:4-amino-4-deoxy-L-arabinose transferase-like glycosyltransferase